MATAEIHQFVMASCSKFADERPLAFFVPLRLDRPNFRIINVHMFNPYVMDLSLAEFLGYYAEVVSAARYVKDLSSIVAPGCRGHRWLEAPACFFPTRSRQGLSFLL